MINPTDDANVPNPFDDEDDINELTVRAVTTRPDNELEQELFELANAPTDEDEFRLDGLNDDLSDIDISEAADEELRIVDAYEIGVGYGLDEEELAKLTGKPD